MPSHRFVITIAVRYKTRRDGPATPSIAFCSIGAHWLAVGSVLWRISIGLHRGFISKFPLQIVEGLHT